MEQKTTIRLKAFHIKSFKTRFFDAFQIVALYQLNIALIGTEKQDGISRVSAPFSQIGLIGTEIRSA
ncbi:hypothetical protein DXZ20_26490 [Leptolyngbyaceae cyanobacterium CCMR0081]|uniref:Uncharacterized protein n=1 Tax=Adonisia turfae CCMR0081 TaxID=2292702 RepID=A0A6M0RSC7_9CYAN|nr:hypothetical protein [Adonisia turfae CCMR0081]